MIGYCQPYKDGTHSLHFNLNEAEQYVLDKNRDGSPFKCSLSREQSLAVQKRGVLVLSGPLPTHIWE